MVHRQERSEKNTGEQAQLRFLVHKQPLLLCMQEANPSSGILEPAAPTGGPRSSTVTL